MNAAQHFVGMVTMNLISHSGPSGHQPYQIMREVLWVSFLFVGGRLHTQLKNISMYACAILIPHLYL